MLVGLTVSTLFRSEFRSGQSLMLEGSFCQFTCFKIRFFPGLKCVLLGLTVSTLLRSESHSGQSLLFGRSLSVHLLQVHVSLGLKSVLVDQNVSTLFRSEFHSKRRLMWDGSFVSLLASKSDFL